MAEPTAERESADAGRRDDPRRRRAAVISGGPVDLAPCAAPAHTHRVRCVVDHDLFEAGQVDHEPIVHDPQTTAVMAAAADRDRKLIGARERDAANHILGAVAPDQQRGVPVDHCVVHGTCIVITGIARAGDAVVEISEFAACAFAQRCGGGHPVLPV